MQLLLAVTVELLYCMWYLVQIVKCKKTEFIVDKTANIRNMINTRKHIAVMSTCFMRIIIFLIFAVFDV